MTTLTHRGYQGAVEYEDGTIVIQLLHIEDFITATCDSAKEVDAVFKELVDDYLATCAELGKEPNKPYKGSLNIRMEPEFHREIAMAAVSAGVSLNTWIVSALQRSLLEGEKAETPIVLGDVLYQSDIANLHYGFSLGRLPTQTEIFTKQSAKQPHVARMRDVKILVNNVATIEETWGHFSFGGAKASASRKVAS